MTERIIAVDVGNSRVKAGVVDLGAPGSGTAPDAPLPAVVDCVHLPVKTPMGWQRLKDWFRSAGAANATWWLASVNPPVHDSLIDWLDARGQLHRELRDPSLLPLSVDLPFPEKAGIDRLLNAVAANAVRPKDKPAIIVDAGSAMTIDAVSADGTFLGGAILPGLALGARALHEFTYALPLVDLGGERPSPTVRRGSPDPAGPGDLRSAPWAGSGDPRPTTVPPTIPCPLGKNTTDALAAGLYWGTVGAVRELLDRLTEHLAWIAPLTLLTGGDAPCVAPRLGRAHCHLPHLTLQGIGLAAADQRPAV